MFLRSARYPQMPRFLQFLREFWPMLLEFEFFHSILPYWPPRNPRIPVPGQKNAISREITNIKRRFTAISTVCLSIQMKNSSDQNTPLPDSCSRSKNAISREIPNIKRHFTAISTVCLSMQMKNNPLFTWKWIIRNVTDINDMNENAVLRFRKPQGRILLISRGFALISLLNPDSIIGSWWIHYFLKSWCQDFGVSLLTTQ